MIDICVYNENTILLFFKLMCLLLETDMCNIAETGTGWTFMRKIWV